MEIKKYLLEKIPYIIIGFLLGIMIFIMCYREKTEEKIIYRKIKVYTPQIVKDTTLQDSIIVLKNIIKEYQKIIKSDSLYLKQQLTEKKQYSFEDDKLKLLIKYYGIFYPYKLDYTIKPIPIETTLVFKKEIVTKTKTDWKIVFLAALSGFTISQLLKK